MGTNLSAPKPERNYLLDFIKLFATVLCLAAHVCGFVSGYIDDMSSCVPAVANPALQNTYMYQTVIPSFGAVGYVIVSFFIFTTGYWFIHAFQRTKKTGVFGKGKDHIIVFRYAVKNWANYLPYLILGCLAGLILNYTVVPENRFQFAQMISHVLHTLPQWLGLNGLGFSFPTLYPQLDAAMGMVEANAAWDYSNVWLLWNGPLWYMYAAIAWMPIAYWIFMKSESFGLFVFCPIMWTAYAGYYAFDQDWSFYANDPALIRFLGPAALGIYGWYIVDYLKKKEFSKKGLNIMGVLAVISLGILIHSTWTAKGGMAVTDMSWAIFLIFVLLMKDPFTVGLNKVCKHIPLAKHVGTAALCMYLLHYPICGIFGYMVSNPIYSDFVAAVKSFSHNERVLILCGFLLLCAVPFHFLDKYCFKKMSAGIIKFCKADEPVVIEAPKAEA